MRFWIVKHSRSVKTEKGWSDYLANGKQYSLGEAKKLVSENNDEEISDVDVEDWWAMMPVTEQYLKKKEPTHYIIKQGAYYWLAKGNGATSNKEEAHHFTKEEAENEKGMNGAIIELIPVE